MLTPKQTPKEFLDRFFLESLQSTPAYSIDAVDTRIKLDQNETAFDWDESLKKRICDKVAGSDWNRYPSAFADELSNRIADHAGVDVRSITSGPGSNVLISVLLSCLARKLSGKMVIAQPSFPLYEMHCRYDGTPYEVWPLNENLEYDVKLLPELSAGSVVIFASPNNPVGNTLDKKSFASLLGENPDCLFVADEAYYEFVDDDYTDLCSSYSNLIIVRTFSKTLGLASLRLAYLIASPEITQTLLRLRLPYWINKFSAIAATEILAQNHIQETIKERVHLVKQERERMRESLGQFSAVHVFPSEANFLLLRCRDQESCEEIYRSFIAHDILVRNVSRGPKLGGCMRVTVGCESENDAFIEACKKIL